MRGLEINLSFDEAGKISRISIQPNQLKEPEGYRLTMKREIIMDVINNLVPEEERGAKLDQQIRMSFGRASGEVILYKNVRIDLTSVCQLENCGITFAEIKWRTK